MKSTSSKINYEDKHKMTKSKGHTTASAHGKPKRLLVLLHGRFAHDDLFYL